MIIITLVCTYDSRFSQIFFLMFRNYKKFGFCKMFILLNNVKYAIKSQTNLNYKLHMLFNNSCLHYYVQNLINRNII